MCFYFKKNILYINKRLSKLQMCLYFIFKFILLCFWKNSSSHGERIFALQPLHIFSLEKVILLYP